MAQDPVGPPRQPRGLGSLRAGVCARPSIVYAANTDYPWRDGPEHLEAWVTWCVRAPAVHDLNIDCTLV